MSMIDQAKTCAQNVFNKMESGNKNINPIIFGKELKKTFGMLIPTETITEVWSQIIELQKDAAKKGKK